MQAFLARYPSLPYVVPFVIFLGLLWLGPRLPVSPRVEMGIRVSVLLAVIWLFARPVLSFQLTRPLGTIVVGIVVFVIWIAPDQLIPGYRDLILFQNAIVGTAESSMPVEARSDWLVLSLRFFRAAVIVPIVEELFWRGWLVRWIDHPDDFRKGALGQMSRFAFLGTGLLFALEHGPYWEVGLVAGLIYNWWMVKSKTLGDLIWCHAITNACLSIWVLAAGQWQYW
jgi:hypothetical protein